MRRTSLKLTIPPLQLLGACLWPAFLWAGVATILFFATFDPTHLGKVATYQLPLSRSTGYTLGFFGFWLLGITCSLSTQFLLGHIQVEARSSSRVSPHTPEQQT
jgi:hypothetical protein